jgi:bacteriocin biosynthesis cyclodehydratase domain-containing protein
MTQTADPTPDITAGDEPFSAAHPRLRHDVVFAEVNDGVLLRDSDNGFVLKGKSAYRLASLMFPFLTGEHSVGELCADLPPGHRDMVVTMIRTLFDRGLARDARPVPSGLAEPVRLRFASQLNFVDHYADDPDRRFSAFRTSRVLVAGTGETAVAAAASLLGNGLERLDLTTSGAAVPDELTRTAAELTAGGCAVVVQPVMRNPADLTTADLAGYDVVLLTAGFGGDLELEQLLRLASHPQPGPVLIPAFAVGPRAIAGPLIKAGASPCWVCALLRLDGNLDPGDMSRVWRAVSLPGPGPAGSGLSQPVARMFGNMLAFDLFRLRTGALPAELDGSVLIQDLDTLESSREHVLPHPACPACRGTEGTGSTGGTARPAAEAGQLSTGELTDRRQKALYGRHTGIVCAFTDGSLAQSPLKVARLRIGLGGAKREIAAFDLHTAAAARARALDAVAVTYADAVAFTAHAVRATDRVHNGNGSKLALVTDAALLTWAGLTGSDAGSGEPEPAWLPATSLGTGETRYVPAAAVYPSSGLNSRGRFERTGAGTGAGRTSAEAHRAGLLSAVSYLALRNAMAAAGTARRVTPAALGADAEIDFLLGAAETVGRPVTLLGLAAPGPAHVLLAVAEAEAQAEAEGRPRWAVGAALTGRDAAMAALRDLVGAMQLASGQDQPPDLGPELLPDLDPRTVLVMADDRPAPEPAAGELAGCLLASGYDALAVDTTPPDLAGTGLFATTRVLLGRSAVTPVTAT